MVSVIGVEFYLQIQYNANKIVTEIAFWLLTQMLADLPRKKTNQQHRLFSYKTQQGMLFLFITLFTA